MMSDQQPTQNIYSEAKILKKKRKRDEEQGLVIGNNTKEIICSILPDIAINQLDKNLETKVFRRHIALHRSPPKPEAISRMSQNSKSDLRRQRYLHLERLIKLEQKGWRYEAFVPLHNLWLGYMSELLGINFVPAGSTPCDPSFTEQSISDIKALPPMISVQSKLLKSDYHGAILTVSRAKNPSLVGLQGIVVQESQETFKLIDPSHVVKCIPKRHTVFKIELEMKGIGNQIQKLVLEIFGNQFAFRAADRVGKKFKTKAFVEL
ncbi:Rof/RNase P-like protein [Melampsora americana]|nr:Rof/RNase P-like protein [Melampsora americana]